MTFEAVRTLGSILANERQVQVSCDTCRALHRFTADEIRALADRVGYDYSLVDRRCRCRLTSGCSGWNRFDYLAGVYRPMVTPDAWAAQSDRDWQRRMRKTGGD